MFAYKPYMPPAFDNPILHMDFAPEPVPVKPKTVLPTAIIPLPATQPPVILEHIKAVYMGDTIYITDSPRNRTTQALLTQVRHRGCHIIQIRPDQLARLPIPKCNRSTETLYQYGVGGAVKLKGVTQHATITAIHHRWGDVWAQCEYRVHSQRPMISYRKLTELEPAS